MYSIGLNRLIHTGKMKNCKVRSQIYNINGKLFLLGCTMLVEEIGSGDQKYLYELMDISTEIETGDSYSMYVDTLSFFSKASTEEVRTVNEFLKKLYNHIVK